MKYADAYAGRVWELAIRAGRFEFADAIAADQLADLDYVAQPKEAAPTPEGEREPETNAAGKPDEPHANGNSLVERTAFGWAAREGRGYLCSTES